MGGKKKEKIIKEEKKLDDDCKSKWIYYDKKLIYYCPIHEKYFEKECQFYKDPEIAKLPILDKNGNFKYPQTPILPLETIPEGFLAEKLEFTHIVVDSHRLVVNSQGVVVNFTQLVVKLSDVGLSQKKIAKKLGVSQQYICKVLKPFKGKGITERFHNFRIKFKAITNFDAIVLPEIKLNNGVSYKKIELQDYFIQVFRKSIIIVFKEYNNIVGLDVVSAQNKAYKMIEEVISRLPKEIVITDKVEEVVGRHNAFVNHPSAKYDLKIYDDEGKLRIISDHSKGKLEKETVNAEFCITDSKKIERHDKDMILKDGYTHSEAKTKIDGLEGLVIQSTTELTNVINTMKTDALVPLTAQLQLHLGVLGEIKEGTIEQKEATKQTNEVLKNIDASIHRFSKVTEKLNANISSKKTSRQTSKAHRIKAIKTKYGW